MAEPLFKTFFRGSEFKTDSFDDGFIEMELRRVVREADDRPFDLGVL